jgi:hypothetical protein
MAKKKLLLDDDPALSYISPVSVPEQQTIDGMEAPKPEISSTVEARLGSRKVEPRDKRIHCLLRPSFYTKLKSVADQHGVSLNDLINTLLETGLES